MSENKESLRDILEEISALEKSHCPSGVGFATLDQARIVRGGSDEEKRQEVPNTVRTALIVRDLLATAPEVARRLRKVVPQPFRSSAI